ncbi:MAG: anti-sigma F factor antagonist [Desulfotomaculaceae bacterium]|nr:anti-sigma F factor antagonist [Desulfotomaculaceae bacterium]
MLLDIEFKQDTLLVRPGGELDLSVADFFRNNLEESLDREPATNIVFNLAQVSFVDSSVLGVLLGRYKRVSKKGGKVIIVSPQPQVRKILELSGLFRIMGESDSEAEALLKLG